MVQVLSTILSVLLSLLVGCLSIIVFLAICYIIYWNTNSTVTGLAKFPGPSLWTLMKTVSSQYGYSDVRVLFFSLMRQYGSRFKTIFSPEYPYLVISTPADLQFLLTHPDLLDKGPVLDFYEPWFGQGLINAHTSKWKLLRKASMPFFSLRNIRNLYPVIQNQATELCKKLAQQTGSSEFNIKPILTQFSYEMALLLTTGISEEKLELDFVRGAAKFAKAVAKRPMRPWYFYDFLWKFSHASKEQLEAAQILDTTFKEAISKGREGSGILYQEIQNQNGVDIKHRVRENRQAEGHKIIDSEEEILRGVMNVAAGASGTTGVTLSWIFYFLGTLPNEQKLLQEEVDSVIEKVTANGHSSCYDLMREMRKMDSFFDETMRLFPTIDLIERRAAREVCFGDGTLIPAGTLLLGFLGMASRNPDVFPDPNTFDMTRFLHEKKQELMKRHPFLYLPFSGGPRNCIGSQVGMIVIKSVMIEVMSRYNVTTHSRLEEIGCNYYLGMHPKNGIRISLENRNK